MSQINSNIQNMNRPSLVSFFHGVGGMSKGAHKAGFETLYASDMWPAAQKAFSDNSCEGYFDLLNFFKNTGKNIVDKIYENSDRTFNYRDIDAVVSGSPCQGMSGVNPNRATFNFKNMLMMKQIRIAGMQGLGAKTAWFEQVPGFLDKPMRSGY
jgi:DNA (cytosine-5)-methyltransferase 1